MQLSIRDVQMQFGLSDRDLQVLKSALSEAEPPTTPAIEMRAPGSRTPGLLHLIEQRLGSVL